ncbi:MAG: phosphoenolpyruvate--protein phosphotransferase [Nocardioidaceae bacterium]|nr:phosphoenolpyruvate--protein phosphotransferase [Nocardioidaceae bacterium]
MTGGVTLRGTAASPGVAVGPVQHWDAAPAVHVEPAADLADASRRVVDDLGARAEAAVSIEGRAVLQTLAMLAADPELLGAANARIEAGESPSLAVRAAARGYADQLRSLGSYLRERAHDVVDVGARLAASLDGREAAELPNPGTPYILVAADLAPTETALLDSAVVLGIVTELGGVTSHTTILARSLGIPALVVCTGASELATGQQIVIDGSSGELHVQVDDRLVESLRARERQMGDRLARAGGPGATADGTAVALLANVGTINDALNAASADVEGVGLFRTEFLFLDRNDEPDLDEQAAAYAAVLDAFGDRRVIFRTLDAGSDKPLPFLHLPAEDNPALGIRGVRTWMLGPSVLERQLAALATAAAQTGRRPWVMAPMVATVDEAERFAGLARAAGLTTVGVMVEVPAAALRSAHLLAAVDFASVGTNDLAQYALAADRQVGRLGSLLDPWQPAVLDLVAATCAGAQQHRRLVGVCGEAAADPRLAAVLVGMGVRSLSMAPVALPGVRALLAAVDLETCCRAAELARQARSAPAARSAVADLLAG